MRFSCHVPLQSNSESRIVVYDDDYISTRSYVIFWTDVTSNCTKMTELREKKNKTKHHFLKD